MHLFNFMRCANFRNLSFRFFCLLFCFNIFVSVSVNAVSDPVPGRVSKSISSDSDIQYVDDETSKPCVSGQDNRKSDLCAQWKAADAAYNSAIFAFWSLLISIFGFFGLILTLFYTRKSSIASIEASRAALDSVKVMRVQERPWIVFKTYKCIQFTNGCISGVKYDSGLISSIVFTNIGKRPAQVKYVFIDCQLVPAGSLPPDFHDPPDGADKGVIAIGPGFDFSSTDIGVGGSDYKDILERKIDVYIRSRIEYGDYVLDIVGVTDVCGRLEYNGEIINENKEIYPNFIFNPIGGRNIIL
ncbi:MAG: hypothetical protein ACOVN0_07835 [Niveispirillum sp.]|uniref:hypothetical protein n=1 Tax=Niveispirillum sp. TaxID=1917217 RepID=UPI003BA6D73C